MNNYSKLNSYNRKAINHEELFRLNKDLWYESMSEHLAKIKKIIISVSKDESETTEQLHQAINFYATTETIDLLPQYFSSSDFTYVYNNIVPADCEITKDKCVDMLKQLQKNKKLQLNYLGSYENLEYNKNNKTKSYISDLLEIENQDTTIVPPLE